MEIEILRRQGNSLRDIAVETSMAVNTVLKYLASGPPQRKARQTVAGKLAPFKGYQSAGPGRGSEAGLDSRHGPQAGD